MKIKSLNKYNKKNIKIDKTVKIGNNVEIYENNTIIGTTCIGNNCVIYPNSFIKDCEIKDNVIIKNSVLENCTINSFSQIGPFSHIKTNSKIGKYCRIGNFVEVKNSVIGNNSKASHLAYIGDCEIGENCNIGCGVIFVNYNGKEKNKTIVGNNCFIGSNCNIIAPLKIDDNTYICAGTTLTKNTKEYDFVIGRVREEIKPQKAKKYLK